MGPADRSPHERLSETWRQKMESQYWAGRADRPQALRTPLQHETKA